MTSDGADSFQTVASAFSRSESELTSLVLSVENVLSHYYENEPRFPVDPEEEDLARLCGYRSEFDGNFSQLEDRLNNKLSESAYNAHSNYKLDISDLAEILDEEYYSLPIVELHSDYYEEADYIVQPGQYGKNETPILIPVAVDDGQVLYWDPFIDFYYGGPEDTRERAISDTKFIKLWSDASKTNWTFWIDRAPQQKLSGFNEADA